MASETEKMLREDLESKNEILDKIKEAALVLATVVCVQGPKLVLTKACASGDMLEALTPGFKLVAGDVVTLHPMTGQIIAKAPYRFPGPITLIKEDIRPDGYVEVEAENRTRMVLAGTPALKLEKGCRVVLDTSSSVVVLNLGKVTREFARGDTHVEWSHIGGLEAAKKAMVEAVEFPHKYPAIFAAYGHKPPKGILMAGPPGCGKTLLGKATATAMTRIYGDKAQGQMPASAFLYVKGPEILDKYVGVAEGAIRGLFARAADHKKEYGFPAVIFVDEAESILSKRGSGISSDMEKTVVPSFLAEMDGLDDSGAIVILATNRPDRLDPAVIRPGRIDRKVYVNRPRLEHFADIVNMNLNGRAIANNTTIEELSSVASAEIYNPARAVTKKEGIDIFLHHTVSGALAANVVETAVSAAISRDIARASGNNPKAMGVTLDDILTAVDDIHEQARMVDHGDVVAELKEAKVAATQRARSLAAA